MLQNGCFGEEEKSVRKYRDKEVYYSLIEEICKVQTIEAAGE